MGQLAARQTTQWDCDESNSKQRRLACGSLLAPFRAPNAREATARRPGWRVCKGQARGAWWSTRSAGEPPKQSRHPAVSDAPPRRGSVRVSCVWTHPSWRTTRASCSFHGRGAAVQTTEGREGGNSAREGEAVCVSATAQR